MFNRRQIREKILQTLYSYHLEGGSDLQKGEKAMLGGFQKAWDSYILLLSFIVDVCRYTEQYADEMDARPLARQHGILESRRLFENPIINQLVEAPSFTVRIRELKGSAQFDSELIRKIFLSLSKTEQYENYCSAESLAFSAHREILITLLSDILVVDESLTQEFEERNLAWPADDTLIFNAVVTTLQSAKEDKIKLEGISKDWPSDKEFAVQLFRKAILKHDEYRDMIASQTPNWEADRISQIDMLVLILAVAELEHFPEIPVKVSLNEYIELAKEYGTPKSKVFVNGVLDNLSKQLKNDGRMVKSGRGLKE